MLRLLVTGVMVFGFCIMYAPNFIQKTDTEGFGEGFKKLFSRPHIPASAAALKTVDRSAQNVSKHRR